MIEGCSRLPGVNERTGEDAAEIAADDLLPVKVDVLRVLEIGVALWAVALVLTIAVPALHGGDRGWWPWSCVAGIVGGAAGWVYVRRGRGNAAAA